MEENLVIVESPAKAKTIEKFLGNGYIVKSSFGHIRDLSKKNLGINIQNNFEPEYIVPDDKKKIVSELKKQVKNAKTVWLASDEDREGEAIAWHLSQVLELNPKNLKRIVFNEITKEAIHKAIKNPRDIDYNLVSAQQARRILDRLVGFELSPLLWKKVKPNLSAGRVQSVAVRLIVEREREIINFSSVSSFKVNGIFELLLPNGKTAKLESELSTKFNDYQQALDFVKKCEGKVFKVSNIVVKPAKKSPSPPFTTSTLQQEASRKLGYSVTQTMVIAQKLYEAGKITYMRTDSVNLSESAIGRSKDQILKVFGSQYSNPRNYTTKSKGAQEAHEAIRPTYFEDETINASPGEKKLYELIWKRTIASQMSDAQIERTVVTISANGINENFIATGEVLKFDGFLKVYLESNDEESDQDNTGMLPPVNNGQQLKYLKITATQKFTHHPPRYTEASLVKKLEELGIGRPSTYAPTISTIQLRGYVVKEDRPGIERKFKFIVLDKDQISEMEGVENSGAEKSKLFPNDIGMLVNDYLVDKFNDILDFNFTANVEKDFDEISLGKKDWRKMIEQFYFQFHSKVDLAEKTKESKSSIRELGIDPASGKNVIVRMGKFGPMAQIGESSETEKPKYARLQSGQYIETITLNQALELFRLPRVLGELNGKNVSVGTGRFGPYVQHEKTFASLVKGIDDPYHITYERALELLQAKQLKDQSKVIQQFNDDLRILNGRWGPYIAYGKENFKIPKGADVTKLSMDECMTIIKNSAKPTTAKTKSKPPVNASTKTLAKKKSSKTSSKK